MLEVSGPQIQDQRPQKPINEFFWIFFIAVCQFDLQMTLNLTLNLRIPENTSEYMIDSDQIFRKRHQRMSTSVFGVAMRVTGGGGARFQVESSYNYSRYLKIFFPIFWPKNKLGQKPALGSPLLSYFNILAVAVL